MAQPLTLRVSYRYPPSHVRQRKPPGAPLLCIFLTLISWTLLPVSQRDLPFAKIPVAALM
jgi:hypothetical protein